MSKWGIAINVSNSSAVLYVKTGRLIPKHRAVRLFGESIKWVDDTSYLGVNLDKWLTWSKYVDQVRRKAAQRLGTLGPILNRRSGISIRNGVLLCKQIIRPMMDYACPVWRYATRSHIKKLQVVQFKCLRIATNARDTLVKDKITTIWVPYFSDHIKSLRDSTPS